MNTLHLFVTIANFALLVALSIAHILMYRRFARAEFFNKKENTQLREVNNAAAQVITALSDSQLAASKSDSHPVITIRGK